MVVVGPWYQLQCHLLLFSTLDLLCALLFADSVLEYHPDLSTLFDDCLVLGGNPTAFRYICYVQCLCESMI